MDFSFWPKNCKFAFHKCGPKQTCQNSNRWKLKLKFEKSSQPVLAQNNMVDEKK